MGATRSPAARKRSDRFGRVMTWMCGGALSLCLLLVVALIGLIAWKGLGYFWPGALARVETHDGRVLLGQIWEREEIPDLEDERADGESEQYRIKIKTGNRGLSKSDEFFWIDEAAIKDITYPEGAVLLERARWGNYHGFMVEIRRGDEVLAPNAETSWELFQSLHPEKMAQLEEVNVFDKKVLGEVNHEMERIRLEKRGLELREPEGPERAASMADADERLRILQVRYEDLELRLGDMRKRVLAETVVMEDVLGERLAIPVGEIVRGFRPNDLSFWGGVGVYLSKVWEFVSDEPRESNTEGGIFPAIFGTVMMVIIMSVVVVPLGVLAALYLREYAKQGPVVRIVRIAVNNLAGTPSIVFGVFGLGFFVYIVGGTIDQIFFEEALPRHTYGTGGILWASLTLALLTVPVVIVATEEGLAAVPRAVRQGSLALGATKWETLRKVVLPASSPAILTGMILAMARAAGEVAPLMIVGMVKLAPDLPLDGRFPFFHPERKFMHLGFHIFDVGFQSPNVEAVKPLVFATALLLVALVCVLNLVAILVRNRLRRRYASSQV